MAGKRHSGKLAVILHADIAGSTELVKQDEHLAHERIQETFQRFSNNITKYHGRVRELRGDALLAEFERASGAVSAALAFQADQKKYSENLNDTIQPVVRVGIAMGEVVIADKTITGEGVVLAQRLEQLAEPGGVVIQGAAYETIPGRFPFEYENLGEHEVKGFDEPVRVYSARLSSDTDIPEPEQADHRLRNTLVAFVSVAVVTAGVALMWFKPWEVREELASMERMTFPLPDKPSIAVLPFTNMSDDPEQEYFADGMTEDLITDLSKLSGLFVIARTSVFTYKDKPVKVRQVAQELGVRYVLEGSVRHVDNQVRINAQLIDATTGGHLWAERYDKQLDDVFSIQDDITRQVTTALEVTLTEGEQARYRRGQTTDAKAYEFYAKGLHRYRLFTPIDNNEALRLFEAAVARDPGFLHAKADIGWAELNNWRFRWGEKPKESLARARDIAQTVLSVDEGHSTANALLGTIFRYQGDFDDAIAYGRKAVKTEPNGADVTATLATTLMFALQSDEALTLIERAMRLSPHHPSWYLFTIGAVHRQLGNYEKAVEYHEKYRDRSSPRSANPYLALVYTYTLSGRDKDAQTAAMEALKRNPKFTIKGWMKRPGYADQEEVARIADAFRKAGLPENSS